MEPTNFLQEPYWDDEDDFSLRTENEILKIQLQAQYGASFHFEEQEEDLDPEIEHSFLMQIQEFEKAFTNVSFITVRELLGHPITTPACLLSDADISKELDALYHLLDEHQIQLYVQGKYPERTIYQFITEELIEFRTDNLQFPGMVRCFHYEEFHPNHEIDVREKANEFIELFFRKKVLDEYNLFRDVLFLPEGRTLNQEKVAEKIRQFWKLFPRAEMLSYEITEVHYEWEEAAAQGAGYASGEMSFDIVFEDGQPAKLSGPFKVVVLNEKGIWEVVYFDLPGFPW